MTFRGDTSRRGRLVTAGLIAGIVAAVAIMWWFAYRATAEWRQTSEELSQHRAERTADLLLNGLNRDMRSAERTVLRRLHWAELAYDRPHALSAMVATAFALYPYPEVFFVWRRDAPATATFFVRADRPPAWLDIGDEVRFHPVTPVHSQVTDQFVQHFTNGARNGRPLAAFPITRAGDPYQVVARLLYRTERRDVLESAAGFLVNERWARSEYFPQLLEQMGPVIGGSHGLTMALLDEQGQLVAGQMSRGPVTTRPVRPLFFDPLLLPTSRSELKVPSWQIQVSTADEQSLAFAGLVTQWALPVTTAAAIALGLGLILTSSAIRASADLAKVRSDFVSSVTHELKTPLATIRGVAEALLCGRLSSGKETQEYAQILDQEAKRLARLVDNLLSYSRVTDAREVYFFEPIAPADLIESALRGFESQFAQHGFEPRLEIAADLPPVRADRTTIILALENLIDNALRYSGAEQWIEVRAWKTGEVVSIGIVDHGAGIPSDEISRVVQRFARGRHASSGGSGLGLAIVNQVVTDHGGSLNISSSLGSGTEVRLSLPIASEINIQP